ncbi:transmembrane protein 252-like [Trichomycterus rosablanca]|uniref:transmembrane protein 252-like n=1 Tax=Trichomycterus rosablanca TaxID=2290929 RepID=UPI002F35982D
MAKRKHLLSAARLLLPTVGLILICVGAYIKSIQNENLLDLMDVSTYLFIILGFILLVIGVLWSVGHGMKNVWLKRREWRNQNADIQVFTVDRCYNYPPSYEESEVRNNVVDGITPIILIPTGIRWPGSAPPVYTESCYETFSEDYSHEEPPNYQQVILQCQSLPEAACPPRNSFSEPF